MGGSMVQHLGATLRAARQQQRVKMGRISAHLDYKSESALLRFERGEVQPSDLDATVEAYALWRAALDAWEFTRCDPELAGVRCGGAAASAGVVGPDANW